VRGGAKKQSVTTNMFSKKVFDKAKLVSEYKYKSK
jgi:hypothetical protein